MIASCLESTETSSSNIHEYWVTEYIIVHDGLLITAYQSFVVLNTSFLCYSKKIIIFILQTISDLFHKEQYRNEKTEWRCFHSTNTNTVHRYFKFGKKNNLNYHYQQLFQTTTYIFVQFKH